MISSVVRHKLFTDFVDCASLMDYRYGVGLLLPFIVFVVMDLSQKDTVGGLLVVLDFQIHGLEHYCTIQ